MPVAYAYDGDYIFGHTSEGLKVQMLRKNPLVCFEVDRIDDMANWRSAIIIGKFQELLLNEVESKDALRLITNKMIPL